METKVGDTAIEGWFDGACGPKNPGGHAGCGYLIKKNGKKIVEKSVYLGRHARTSNNVAEFAAAILLLNELRNIEGEATIYGDSEMVVRACNRGYKKASKSALYYPFYLEILDVFEEFRDRVRVVWVPRELNSEADALSKLAIRWK